MFRNWASSEHIPRLVLHYDDPEEQKGLTNRQSEAGHALVIFPQNHIDQAAESLEQQEGSGHALNLASNQTILA